VLDADMVRELGSALEAGAAMSQLRAVLLDAEGPHFSFGASVEEHLPEPVAAMLRGFHGLIGRMLDFPVPILVAVQGRCLGGGLELACAGGPIFASLDAMLGQPEIKLGVLAPAASCLLPRRIGEARAEDLLTSGRNIDAWTAFAWGLVTKVSDDARTAALEYFDQYLAGLSASSLRHAVTASRARSAAELKARIAELERYYLGELMATSDALEGLSAFLEKRTPRWQHG
jgi:cyclohexa-1,5-dienecarbonyl-CoA hydratase